ncbi:hypothetical protein F5880DRAFT_1632021 [Lentinula raphanica]|nr:hypothetical protein F5880DRAFT_1632021 [Lentinula raphanica]
MPTQFTLKLVSPLTFIFTFLKSPLSRYEPVFELSFAQYILAGAYLTHYLNRAIISPLRTPSRSKSHIIVPFSGVLFNVLNGSLWEHTFLRLLRPSRRSSVAPASTPRAHVQEVPPSVPPAYTAAPSVPPTVAPSTMSSRPASVARTNESIPPTLIPNLLSEPELPELLEVADPPLPALDSASLATPKVKPNEDEDDDYDDDEWLDSWLQPEEMGGSENSSEIRSKTRWTQTSSRRMHAHDVRSLAIWPPYTPLPPSHKQQFPSEIAPVIASGGLDMSVVVTPAALPSSTLLSKVINPLATSVHATFDNSYHRRLAYSSGPSSTSAIHIARQAHLLTCTRDSRVSIWTSGRGERQVKPRRIRDFSSIISPMRLFGPGSRHPKLTSRS